MARNFKELEAKMRPEILAQSEARAKEMMAEMLFAEIRDSVDLTHEELAAVLGIKQPASSRLETPDEMQVGTLRNLVRALGGDLEIIVHLPNGDFRIRQFDAV